MLCYVMLCYVMLCYVTRGPSNLGGCKIHAGSIIGGEFVNSLDASFVRKVNCSGREE